MEYVKYKKQDIEQLFQLLNQIQVVSFDSNRKMAIIEQIIQTAQPCEDELLKEGE